MAGRNPNIKALLIEERALSGAANLEGVAMKRKIVLWSIRLADRDDDEGGWRVYGEVEQNTFAIIVRGDTRPGGKVRLAVVCTEIYPGQSSPPRPVTVQKLKAWLRLPTKFKLEPVIRGLEGDIGVVLARVSDRLREALLLSLEEKSFAKTAHRLQLCEFEAKRLLEAGLCKVTAVVKLSYDRDL